MEEPDSSLVSQIWLFPGWLRRIPGLTTFAGFLAPVVAVLFADREDAADVVRLTVLLLFVIAAFQLVFWFVTAGVAGWRMMLPALGVSATTLIPFFTTRAARRQEEKEEEEAGREKVAALKRSDEHGGRLKRLGLEIDASLASLAAAMLNALSVILLYFLILMSSIRARTVLTANQHRLRPELSTAQMKRVVARLYRKQFEELLAGRSNFVFEKKGQCIAFRRIGADRWATFLWKEEAGQQSAIEYRLARPEWIHPGDIMNWAA